VLALSIALWSFAFANEEPSANDSGDDNQAIVIEEPGSTGPDFSLDGDMIEDTPVPGASIPGSGGGSPPVADPPVSSPPASRPSVNPDAPVSSPPLAANPPAPSGTKTPPPQQQAPGQLPADRQLAPAPIDDADILVLESFPPQYLLHVLAGLPSGCAQAAGHEVVRTGNTIQVRVYNSMPTGMVACTMIYGMYELNIPLGSDFVSGQEYVVEVNDKRLTLRAQ
jgi:hypothetical protein